MFNTRVLTPEITSFRIAIRILHLQSLEPREDTLSDFAAKGPSRH
jgi:hypothetical protein